ncbi:hypothetical protein [Marispirochaeta aestuarii]|uniref:hypothetical protein n=1 Tax=Marispirochaeta aestuarii TaxID=1963862 RepID=UPI002ABE294B|nr:hypothetical protein [Marispirochaeta aestuarii]
MDKKVLEELQQIKKLLILLCLNNLDQKEQIRRLNFAGFQPKDIAEIIGTTSNTVRVTLNRLKNEAEKTSN